MIPRADIPRAAFPINYGRKMPFEASKLVPMFCKEVLPGDVWNVRCTVAARTAVPIVPVQDNWHMETFFFYSPNRLAWSNWVRFMGEQNSPADSIAFSVPQVVSPAGGFAVNSVYDYMGVGATVGQVQAGLTVTISALPFRHYGIICHQWFRDENLQNSLQPLTGDGPDPQTDYILNSRGKRPDYFTTALPWVQKGNTSVTMPLSGQAAVKTSASHTVSGANPALLWKDIAAGGGAGTGPLFVTAATTEVRTTAAGALQTTVYPSNLYADLSTATAATINQLRQSFQIQKLLERDARGGTRYTESVRAHFGVISDDARLQRPEYIGGGHIPVLTSAIPQTSATSVTGSTTPIGTLSATGHAQGSNGFTYAAKEHGYIIGIISARTDLTYQQGIPRHFRRLTRYDFYYPAFAMLGEQPVYNYEIYARGDANDALVFGYQERWAELRNFPSEVAGLYRSTAAGTLDYWHSAEKFTALPTLNATFITDPANNVLQRNFAGGALTANQQFFTEINFSGTVVRALPRFSTPGLIDHF